MSQNEAQSSRRFIDPTETDDDPFSVCRENPEYVRELKAKAEEKGFAAFAAACDAVLEEVDQS